MTRVPVLSVHLHVFALFCNGFCFRGRENSAGGLIQGNRLFICRLNSPISLVVSSYELNFTQEMCGG